MLQRYAAVLLESSFFTHQVSFLSSLQAKRTKDLWFMWSPSGELGFDFFLSGDWLIVSTKRFIAFPTNLSKHRMQIYVYIYLGFLFGIYLATLLGEYVCSTQLWLSNHPTSNIFFLMTIQTVGGSLAILPFFPYSIIMVEWKNGCISNYTNSYLFKNAHVSSCSPR